MTAKTAGGVGLGIPFDLFGGGGDRSAGMSAALARNWWAMALRGVAALLFGLATFLLPAAAILSLVLLFGAYMLVDGIFAIVAGVRAIRKDDRWGLLILQGVFSLLAAAVAFLWPAITVLAFVFLYAAWSLVTGVLALWAAFSLKADHGRWWLGLTGVLSIVAGVLLAVMPLVGALVLTWWIGAYAVVYGVTMLVLAFRLRTHHDTAQAATA